MEEAVASIRLLGNEMEGMLAEGVPSPAELFPESFSLGEVSEEGVPLARRLHCFGAGPLAALLDTASVALSSGSLNSGFEQFCARNSTWNVGICVIGVWVFSDFTHHPDPRATT